MKNVLRYIEYIRLVEYPHIYIVIDSQNWLIAIFLGSEKASIRILHEDRKLRYSSTTLSLYGDNERIQADIDTHDKIVVTRNKK